MARNTDCRLELITSHVEMSNKKTLALHQMIILLLLNSCSYIGNRFYLIGLEAEAQQNGHRDIRFSQSVVCQLLLLLEQKSQLVK